MPMSALYGILAGGNSMLRSWSNTKRIAAIVLLVLSFAIAAGAAERRAVKLRVAPAYPEIARRMKITGEVILEAKIDPDGNVTNVKAVSGNHVLGLAAEDAVRKWKFASASESSTETVDLTFDLIH
jgi:TonB family protein